MTEAQKDTIYIDVDDEITGIIDKLSSSDHKIVALVLPKRATVLQSVVNMKLLKRNADKVKKQLVLITSEAGLLPLAGAVGIHVAKNLQSKPAIPEEPDTKDIPESLINEEEIETEDEPDIDAKKPVGELAGLPEEPAAMPEAEETIDLDNSDEAVAAEAKGAKGDKKSKPKKDKKLKVPNFERFRVLLIVGGLALILLVVGGYFALVKMPKASIVINTDSTIKNATIAFTANTANKTFDEAGKSVPGQNASVKKTDVQTAPATGQKNNGDKATGTLAMTSKVCNSIVPPSSVATGTGVSANGLTYITQQTVTFTFDTISGGCINYKSNGTTIAAQNGGTNYNTTSTTFAVAGRADISASGSANNGTDNMIKVVAQADVDAAKAKTTASTTSDAAKAELTANLKKDGMLPITSSLTADGPNATTTPKVGEQGDSVSVSSVTTYTMLGINQANLAQFIGNQLKTQIDANQQTVLDDGLGGATFTVNGKDNPQVSVQTSATVGPNVNVDTLKKDIAGKKKAEAIEIIQSRPSIKGASVNLSPFWVTKVPGNPQKVTVTFQKATN